MDMKKKLEDAYNPDKGARKERIILGLSGGIDSMVTAYLLKIQKYDLFAVTIVNGWDELPLDQSSALSCHITQSKLDDLKEFCNKMSIPHHVVKASVEFKENVIEPWISSRISGKYPTHCWNCHDSRMELLHSKMKELGATQMATGHFAKLFHNDTHNSVFIHTSNDEENDQSSLLSRLPNEILSSMILPLSDLNKKEVLKLAENFGIISDDKVISIHKCLEWKDEFKELIDKKVPQKFLKVGEMVTLEGNITISDHTGVQTHGIGEEIEYKDSGKSQKGFFGEFNYSDKKMVIVNEAYFIRKRFLLTKCNFSKEVSWVEPMKGYIQLNNNAVECWIYPKPLSSVLIELIEPHKAMNGEIVTVLKKKGKNAKIFLTGEVQFLAIEPVNEEGEPIVPKVNYNIDF